MAIKQVIQYREANLDNPAETTQWAVVSANGLLPKPQLGWRSEVRIHEVYPVGYKFKSKWGCTIYEVIGEPVTSKYGVEENVNYPIRATEEDGDVWHEFEREEVIAKAEEVK